MTSSDSGTFDMGNFMGMGSRGLMFRTAELKLWRCSLVNLATGLLATGDPARIFALSPFSIMSTDGAGLTDMSGVCSVDGVRRSAMAGSGFLVVMVVVAERRGVRKELDCGAKWSIYGAGRSLFSPLKDRPWEAQPLCSNSSN